MRRARACVSRLSFDDWRPRAVTWDVQERKRSRIGKETVYVWIVSEVSGRWRSGRTASSTADAAQNTDSRSGYPGNKLLSTQLRGDENPSLAAPLTATSSRVPREPVGGVNRRREAAR